MIGRDDFIEIIRKELTSGAATSTELINVILKAIRDKLPIAIQQDVDGATYIVVKTDNVGLAKSTDISATQPRDITDRAGRLLGLQQPIALGVLAWNAYAAAAGATVVVDTLGFSDLVVFSNVSAAADITLDAVSQDNTNFRTVGETVHSYAAAGSSIDDLNSVITTKSSLKYRYLKFKVSAAVTVTLEVSGKHPGVNSILSKDELGLFKTADWTESRDVNRWGGTTLTGRNISGDLANLDIALSEIKNILEPYRYTDFLPLPQTIAVTQVSATAAGTTATGTALTPPTGKVFYLHYIRLITDAEVSGNVLIDTVDTAGRELLAVNQGAGLDIEHDLTKLTHFGVRCTSVNIRSTTGVALTADRTVKVELGISICDKLW